MLLELIPVGSPFLQSGSTESITSATIVRLSALAITAVGLTSLQDAPASFLAILVLNTDTLER